MCPLPYQKEIHDLRKEWMLQSGMGSSHWLWLQQIPHYYGRSFVLLLLCQQRHFAAARLKKIRDQNWRPTWKTTTNKQKGCRRCGPAPCLGSHSYVGLWWRPKGQGSLFSSSSVAVLDQVQLRGTLKSCLRLEMANCIILPSANKLIQKISHSGKVKFHISYMLYASQ